MAYKVSISKRAVKQIAKLDKKDAKRILDHLEEIDGIEDPRTKGKALTGTLRGLWRYRVGDYRIICDIRDNEMVVVAVSVAHRRDIYR